jgi:catechol 2,3-dioxygenase-like lactoylglutathione lyase family enzyme
MLGKLDHVGYLVRDLDSTVEEFVTRFGLPVARYLELPQFSLLAKFLGPDSGSIELFTFTDPGLLDQRLAGAEVRFDHAAHEVADIEAAVAHMRLSGVRFCGPDRREEVDEPFLLGGVLHLWTIPESAGGQAIQMLQR